jgi:ribose/xylose/arabinose/galactoside ABC-type transport system permease subunit
MTTTQDLRDNGAEAQEHSGAAPTRGRTTLVHLARDYGMHLALGVLVLAFSITTPEFRTTANLINVLNQVAVVGIISVGMTFVILTKGIDLSVGSMLALAGLASAVLATGSDHGALTVVLAFAVPLVLGAIAGAVNGVVVATGLVTPLIVTLGTLTAYRGLAVWFHVNPVYGLPDWYRVLGAGKLFGIPYGVISFGAIVAIASLVLNKTRFGREIYAVGGNEHASRASGINVRRIQFTVYVISGVCVGIAAIIAAGRVGAAQATGGTGLELQAIAAVVVGGVSLFGGRGKISNTVIGVLVLGVLFNGLVLMNVSSPIQNVIIGIIIVGAALADGLFRRGHS